VVDAGRTSDAGTVCNSANPEPDICGYGNVCNASNGCDAIIEGTCSNVAAAVAKNNHTLWTRTTSTGPVIYKVVPAAAVQTDCANLTDGGVPSAFTLTVYAYSNSDFPANESNVQGFWYFPTNGNKVDVPGELLKPSNYTASGKNMSAKFTLCSTPGATTTQAAFAFTNGNAYCANLTK